MTDRVHDEAGRFESKYDPAYCGEVRQYGEDGYSTSAMAAKLKVSRQTLYNWAESHPEFAAALDQGIALAGAWWEDRLRDILFVADRARIGLRIGAVLPFQPAQIVDLPLDAVDDDRRLFPAAQGFALLVGQLLSVVVVSRALGLPTPGLRSLLRRLELADKTGQIVHQTTFQSSISRSMGE